MVMTTGTFQEVKEGQMQFQVEFYETEDGRTPTQEFLDSLEPKMNAKMVGLMEILEEKGYSLREPYSAPLEDGIFELRAVQGPIFHVLCFSSTWRAGLSLHMVSSKRLRKHPERRSSLRRNTELIF